MNEAIYIECTGCDSNCHLKIAEREGLKAPVKSGEAIKAHMNQWKQCRKGKEKDNEAKLSEHKS